jgi:hypothetical protein
MSLDFSQLINLSSVKPQELIKESKKGYNKEVTKGDFKILKNGGIVYSEAFRKELAVEKEYTVSKVDAQTGEINETKGTETFYRFIDFANGNNPSFLAGTGKGFIFGCILPYGAKTASIQGAEGDGTKVTYVKETLIPMIAEVYGIDWEETKEVEMSFLWDKVVAPAANGKHYIPRISKVRNTQIVEGAEVNVPIEVYTVREGVNLVPCVPTALLPNGNSEAIQKEFTTVA